MVVMTSGDKSFRLHAKGINTALSKTELKILMERLILKTKSLTKITESS